MGGTAANRYNLTLVCPFPDTHVNGSVFNSWQALGPDPPSHLRKVWLGEDWPG